MYSACSTHMEQGQTCFDVTVHVDNNVTISPLTNNLKFLTETRTSRSNKIFHQNLWCLLGDTDLKKSEPEQLILCKVSLFRFVPRLLHVPRFLCIFCAQVFHIFKCFSIFPYWYIHLTSLFQFYIFLKKNSIYMYISLIGQIYIYKFNDTILPLFQHCSSKHGLFPFLRGRFFFCVTPLVIW